MNERIFVGGENENPRELSKEETTLLNKRRRWIKIFDVIKNKNSLIELKEWEKLLYEKTIPDNITAEEWADIKIAEEENWHQEWNERHKKEIQDSKKIDN